MARGKRIPYDSAYLSSSIDNFTFVRNPFMLDDLGVRGFDCWIVRLVEGLWVDEGRCQG